MDQMKHQGETAWDSFSAILEGLPSAPIIRIMDSEGRMLEQLLPEMAPLKGMEQGGYHVDDVWEHSMKTLEYFEEIIKECWPVELREGIGSYLGGNLPCGRPRLPLLKLACLIHDIGKQRCRKYAGNGKFTFYGHHREGVPLAENVALRLKLSNNEMETLKILVGLHMAPLFLYQSSPLTIRAVRRYLSKAGTEASGLLLISLADITSSRMSSGREEDARIYGVFILKMIEKCF